jgi:hypothetical protein
MLGSRNDNESEPMYTERNLPPSHEPWIARGSRAGRTPAPGYRQPIPGEDRRLESRIGATTAGNILGAVVIIGILGMIVGPVVRTHK